MFLSEDITHSSEFSNYAVATYCVLKALTTTTTLSKHCISPAQIGFYLIDDIKQSRRFLTYIKCGLDELIENSVIQKENEYMKNYIIDCSSLWLNPDDSKFTIITFEEVKKIFKVENVNNFLLLRYFIYLIGTISSTVDVWVDAFQHKTRVVGNLTIGYISKLSGISERSIIDYNKILEDLELIYIYKQHDFLINEDGDVTQLPNVYGRFCDKEYINAFAINQQKDKSSYKFVNKNLKNANSKRKLAQMYNQLSIGKGEKYTKDDIFEIYKYVLSENKKYRNMYKKNNCDEYLEKIRDVSVFDKYDFLETKEDK